MKKIVIDGNKIKNREDLYASLKMQLMSEDFIGNNLDALADVLTESPEPVEAEIIAEEALWEALGNYAWRLMQVLRLCGCIKIQRTERGIFDGRDIRK